MRKAVTSCATRLQRRPGVGGCATAAWRLGHGGIQPGAAALVPSVSHSRLGHQREERRASHNKWTRLNSRDSCGLFPSSSFAVPATLPVFNTSSKGSAPVPPHRKHQKTHQPPAHHQTSWSSQSLSAWQGASMRAASTRTALGPAAAAAAGAQHQHASAVAAADDAATALPNYLRPTRWGQCAL
jgi:hypothetical protein